MGAQWKAKHKEVAANAKGRVFGKLSKEIMIAARNGADPDMNPKLRLVVEQAKKASMPAIPWSARSRRAPACWMAPPPSSAWSTKLRAAPRAGDRRVPDRQREPHHRGNPRAVPQGPARRLRLGSWDFDYLGLVEATPASADADPELAAIEAGAQDFEPGEEDGDTLFLTDSTDLDAVCRALPEHGFTVASAKLGYKAKNPVSLSGAELEEVEAFLDALDGNDDVQNLYVGLA